MAYNVLIMGTLKPHSLTHHIHAVTSRLLHSLEDILLRTVLFIKLLSCLRSDIAILDTLIVLLTYLLTYLLTCLLTHSLFGLAPLKFFLTMIIITVAIHHRFILTPYRYSALFLVACGALEGLIKCRVDRGSSSRYFSGA